MTKSRTQPSRYHCTVQIPGHTKSYVVSLVTGTVMARYEREGRVIWVNPTPEEKEQAILAAATLLRNRR